MFQNILWAIVIILLILWLLGFFFRFARGLINILLAIAGIIIIINILDYIFHFF